MRKSPEKGNGKRTHVRIGGERWLELENDGMIDVPNPPTGRFTSFTPLTTPIDQVLMQIKDEGTLTFPNKLKGDPSKRPRDKYYRFHRDHGHDTADCYDLKQQIEAFIRQGKL